MEEYKLPQVLRFIDIEEAIETIYLKSVLETLNSPDIEKPSMKSLANI